MKLSDLENIFECEDIENFKKLIFEEVTNYEIRLSKKGSSVPIIVEEDAVLFFDNKKLNFLKNLLETYHFTTMEISYIADAILLSHSIQFQDDAVMTELELLVL